MTTVTESAPLTRESHRPRRALARPPFMLYNRLIIVVVLLNLASIPSVIGVPPGQLEDAVLLAVTINLTVAVVIRQQYVINALFWAATRAPLTWPLRVRAALAKVFHFGGIHVGAAIAASGWYLAFMIVTVTDAGSSPMTTTVTVVIAGLLGVLLLTALPPVRRRRHDLFEAAHRFGGWLLLVLFAALAVVRTADRVPRSALADEIAAAPTTWMLAAVIVSVALPWVRLRRVPVHVTLPSSHVALVDFVGQRSPFAGSSTAVARSPLGQWHSFANISVQGRAGFRLAISRAGDWTGALIDDVPQSVWVKGIATAGVGNIDRLFSKVVWIATGSGIGPCLPHLLAGTTPAKLIWSTRTPVQTYGARLVDEILTAQPDATVWDTTQHGKPDLVALALDAVAAGDAEAVICISNQPTTRHLVASLEARGIPAYGAIWDS